MIVIACNTGRLPLSGKKSRQLDIPVLGVILPELRQLSSPVKVGKSEIERRMTVQSDIYRQKSMI